MYASAVAETPPVISSVTPRSQVINETGSGPMLVRTLGIDIRLTKHRCEEDSGSEEDVSLKIIAFVREEVLFDYLKGIELNFVLDLHTINLLLCRQTAPRVTS
jgi:hypothetical protein